MSRQTKQFPSPEVWVFPEIYSHSSPPPLQSKVCVRESKQAWWMWPSGWGPAPITPEGTRLQAGIRYPGLSSRSCLNKTQGRAGPDSVTVCYLPPVVFCWDVTASLMVTCKACKQECCVLLSVLFPHSNQIMWQCLNMYARETFLSIFNNKVVFFK